MNSPAKHRDDAAETCEGGADAGKTEEDMQDMLMMSKPFVWLLSASTRLLLRVFTIDDNRRSAVTEDEIHAVLAEGSELGVIEQHEHRMVRNLFRLDDLAIVSLMTPRGAIVMLDAASSKIEILAVLESSPLRGIQYFGVERTTSLAWCRRANCCCELCGANRWTSRRLPSPRCSFPKGSVAWTCWRTSGRAAITLPS